MIPPSDIIIWLKIKICSLRNYRNNTNTAKIWTDDDNKEKMTELQSDWRQKNKEKINKKNQERYQTDEQYRIKSQHKWYIHNIFKGVDFMGYSAIFLNDWYVYNAIMNGISIHTVSPTELCVDHLFPLNLFDLTNADERNLAYDWKNTRRIKQSDNREKSNKPPTITELKTQQRHVYDFLKTQTGKEPYIKTDKDKRKYLCNKNVIYYYFQKLENKLNNILNPCLSNNF